MVELDSVAGDGGDGCRSLDDSLAKKVQTQLGLLAIPVKQRVVDCVGIT